MYWRDCSFVRVFVVLSAMCVVLLGCGRAVERINGSDEIRIMSFNIRYGSADDGDNSWQHRREMLFDVIGEYRPDVLGLQEALKFQIDEIMDAIDGYKLIGVGREDGKSKAEYSCILYRADRLEVAEGETFWLSDTPTVPGSITWGNECTRICTWGLFTDRRTGRKLYIYNTHFDHVSQPSRLNSAALIARRIASRSHKDPYILMGDFNAGEDNPAVLYLKGKAALEGEKSPEAMVDTFRILHADEREVRTAHSFSGRRSGVKIDYIFAQPSTKVIEAKIVRTNRQGRYPSDHFPVTARVLTVSD